MIWPVVCCVIKQQPFVLPKTRVINWTDKAIRQITFIDFADNNGGGIVVYQVCAIIAGAKPPGNNTQAHV